MSEREETNDGLGQPPPLTKILQADYGREEEPVQGNVEVPGRGYQQPRRLGNGKCSFERPHWTGIHRMTPKPRPRPLPLDAGGSELMYPCQHILPTRDTGRLTRYLASSSGLFRSIPPFVASGRSSRPRPQEVSVVLSLHPLHTFPSSPVREISNPIHPTAHCVLTSLIKLSSISYKPSTGRTGPL